ncbi:efflux RND transporter periplasmic adaptor subunit [Hyphomicrobium sp.]|uniref:efflux RND transporter periplasmic adaptor subunit n=1 Tax=Hyphomicrobium sp. TaxID=82 RepID=UPI001D78E9B2|nr:efflux RND transporter periplasmic adaptor subunit [Hyphomicrobium sp.]MBY0559780.1 efflux RND transporter periplasmic adaptor subunit [Hyphomicrobium sp.]
MLRFTAVIAGFSTLVTGLTFAHNDVLPSQTFITAPVERGTLSKTITATGTVEARLTVDVSSQLSGRVADVFVSFNDTVTAGQPIARLDQAIFGARVTEAAAALNVATASAEMQQVAVSRAGVGVSSSHTAQKLAEAQCEAAKARLAEAERELNRKLALSKTGVASERELTQTQALKETAAADAKAAGEQIHLKEEAVAIAEAELQMAGAELHNAQATVKQRQAALDQARLDLDRTVLRAPINGVILKRDINPGQTIAVTMEAKTLFQIANDLKEMEIHARIDEADVGQLRPGQAARFTVDAYPDRMFSGEVRQIRKSPETTQNVVTYTAIVSAQNPDLLLLPGMTAALRVSVSDGAVALKVPNEALRFRPVAFKAADSSARRPITQDLTATGDGSPALVWIPDGEGGSLPVAVRIGQRDAKGALLLDGPLTEGELLIVGVLSPERHLVNAQMGL